MKGCSQVVCAIGMGIVACSGSPSSTEPEDFLHKVPQTATERVVDSRLVATDSLRLSDYDVLTPRRILVDVDWIFVDDVGEGRILAVAKEDFETHRFIGRGTGEGPGEMSRFRGFDVLDGELVLANRPGRLSRYTFEGELVGELVIGQHPVRIAAVGDGAVAVLDPLNGDHLLTVVNATGGATGGQGMVPNPAAELRMAWHLRSMGAIDYHDGHIYFAGFSESLIKKYSLDGELVYSVATIDNHSSELNYMESESESVIAAGYTEQALYSALNIRVYGRYSLVQPVRDDAGEVLRYLDAYDATTGKYEGSYAVSEPPEDYAMDAEHLYMLEWDDNPESGERDAFIKVYDNVLGD